MPTGIPHCSASKIHGLLVLKIAVKAPANFFFLPELNILPLFGAYIIDYIRMLVPDGAYTAI